MSLPAPTRRLKRLANQFTEEWVSVANSVKEFQQFVIVFNKAAVQWVGLVGLVFPAEESPNHGRCPVTGNVSIW
jgi:hypothetical protein